jgi:hypothetical protein
MQPLKAHVKNGRLVLDDPATDLPEGEVVFLQPVDGIAALERDEYDEHERAEVHREFEASSAEADTFAEDFWGRDPGAAPATMRLRVSPRATSHIERIQA